MQALREYIEIAPALRETAPTLRACATFDHSNHIPTRVLTLKPALSDTPRALSTATPSWWARTLGACGQCEVCHTAPAPAICTDCAARYRHTTPRCRTCAGGVAAGQVQCVACLRAGAAWPLDACLAAVPYGYPWQGLVQQFKFRDQPQLAQPLAALLRQTAGVVDLLGAADWVLGMPLAPERLAQRGYNPAHDLAKALSPRARVNTAALLRTRATQAQSGLSRTQRLNNLANAFAVDPSRAPQLKGARLVLVDDVMSTGATLVAAAAALQLAGPAHIAALVVARRDRFEGLSADEPIDDAN